MRLIRLDGWGPDGSDLLLDPRLTVTLGAPPGFVGALVRAVRALRDPAVPAPAGTVDVAGSRQPIGAVAPVGTADPVLDLRRGDGVRGGGHGGARGDVVSARTQSDDPGAESRRRAVRRIDELRGDLAAVDASLAASRALQVGTRRGSEGNVGSTGAVQRVELEGAADELALALLHPDATGPDQFCELEQRLRGLVHAADEAAIRVEATTWRIDELRAELAESGGPLEAAAERSVLIAELEAVRAELVELDRRGPVVSGERERLAAVRARAAVLLDELGYDDYVSYLLDDLAGTPLRSGRRDRVTEARRGLLADELERLRATLPGELDAQAAGSERIRLQAEAAALLGLDVAAVRRLTVTEVADVLRARSAGRSSGESSGGTPSTQNALAAAVGRLVRALGPFGAEPTPGSGDPIELLAVARRLLAESAAAAVPPDPDVDLEDLVRRRDALRSELADQERLLGVLVEAAGPETAGPETVGPEAEQLPVGVPLTSRTAGSDPAGRSPLREVEERVAELTGGLPTEVGTLPMVVLVDPDLSPQLADRLVTLVGGLQCIVVCPAASSTWRAIGEDAGRVVEW